MKKEELNTILMKTPSVGAIPKNKKGFTEELFNKFFNTDSEPNRYEFIANVINNSHIDNSGHKTLELKQKSREEQNAIIRLFDIMHNFSRDGVLGGFARTKETLNCEYNKVLDMSSNSEYQNYNDMLKGIMNMESIEHYNRFIKDTSSKDIIQKEISSLIVNGTFGENEDIGKAFVFTMMEIANSAMVILEAIQGTCNLHHKEIIANSSNSNNYADSKIDLIEDGTAKVEPSHNNTGTITRENIQDMTNSIKEFIISNVPFGINLNNKNLDYVLNSTDVACLQRTFNYLDESYMVDDKLYNDIFNSIRMTNRLFTDGTFVSNKILSALYMICENVINNQADESIKTSDCILELLCNVLNVDDILKEDSACFKDILGDGTDDKHIDASLIGLELISEHSDDIMTKAFVEANPIIKNAILIGRYSSFKQFMVAFIHPVIKVIGENPSQDDLARIGTTQIFAALSEMINLGKVKNLNNDTGLTELCIKLKIMFLYLYMNN